MIPVGVTAIPTQGAELAARVAASLREALDLREEHVRVEAGISAPEQVDHLRIDLTHAVVDRHHLAVRPWRPPAPRGGVAATVTSLAVTGAPLVLFGASVAVDLEAGNVPARWVHDEQSRLWLVFTEETSPAGPARGRLAITGDVAALTAAVEQVAGELARSKGLTLRELSVVPRTVGPDRWQVEVRATVTKGFVSSRVSADAQVHLDPALVLHVEQVDVRAGGMLGKIAEGLAEGYLRRVRGRRIPLGARPVAGARLTSLDVDLDGRFHLAATLG